MNVRISDIKRQGLGALKGKWGTAVLLTFVIFLISVFLPTAIEIILSGGFREWYEQDVAPASAQIFSLLLSFAVIPLSVATYWFYLQLVRQDPQTVTDVFRVYSNVSLCFKLIGASIMIGLFVFLWSLLLIIPGIIKSLSYSQTFYILRDHPEYGIFEAITESRKRMNGFKGRYFLLNLSFIGWGILGLFTLGIGYFWLVPYFSASMAVFYNQLIARSEAEMVEE